MSMTLEELEGVGPKFSLDQLMAMRHRTRWAVHAIADGVVPGMAEEEVKDKARKLLESIGMRRGWHHIITRCGVNTTKDFMERSEPGVVLQPDDIFFVDIGPIYGDCEGDAGDTFVLGGDPLHLKAKVDARTIWDTVRDHWFSTGATGRELYAFADKAASDLGWKLNFDLSGHRLSDFPHSAHYDGSIADVDFALRPERWVLEIAIAHPTLPFGAFYEDLLLEDQSFPDWVFDPTVTPK